MLIVKLQRIILGETMKRARTTKAWGYKDRLTKRLIPVAKQSRKFAERKYDYLRYEIVRVSIKELPSKKGAKQ